MNKLIAIPVMAVLGVAVIGVLAFAVIQSQALANSRTEVEGLTQDVNTLQTNLDETHAVLTTTQTQLTDTQTELTDTQGQLGDTQTQLADTEGKLTASQADLADTQDELATTAASLTTANTQITKLKADVSTQQTLNQTLATDLKTVQDPRHFSSVNELVDWLQADDTDTAYADAGLAEGAFVLQVRALRDGYLLPAVIYWDEVNNDGNWIYNIAVIGDTVYGVVFWDDEVVIMTYTQPIPTHPLPL